MNGERPREHNLVTGLHLGERKLRELKMTAFQVMSPGNQHASNEALNPGKGSELSPGWGTLIVGLVMFILWPL